MNTDSVYAEQLAASGAAGLTAQLPADVQELLTTLTPDGLTPDSFTNLDLSTVLGTVGTLFRDGLSGPLAVLALLLAIILLSALFGGLQGLGDRPQLHKTYHTVSVTVSAGFLLGAFGTLLQTVWRSVDSVRVFMGAYVPVYGVIVATGGSPGGALSYQTTLLAAAELLTQGVRGLVLPLLLVSLALGCVGTATEGFNLSSFGKSFYSVVLWGLGLFSTIFSGVLSVQQMVAAAGDSVGNRVMKFSLSGMVPVVGGLMSEAYSTVVGCTGLLRSTVGCFGLVATLLIILPPLLSCVGWNICLSLGANAAALFGLTTLEGLCRSLAGAVRVLIAVLAVYGLLMIVSTSVVAFVGRG